MRLTRTKDTGTTGGTRTSGGQSAPDSQAVFLCAVVFNDRDERPQYKTLRGNKARRPLALVESWSSDYYPDGCHETEPVETFMPTSKRTRALPFLSCDPQQTALLTVNSNVPIADALEVSSVLLDCVWQCLVDHAMNLDDYPDIDPGLHLTWALSYLTEFACAIQNACITSAKQEADHE